MLVVFQYIFELIYKVYTPVCLAKSIHPCLKLRNSYVVSILNGSPLPRMTFSYSKE